MASFPQLSEHLCLQAALLTAGQAKKRDVITGHGVTQELQVV